MEIVILIIVAAAGVISYFMRKHGLGAENIHS
jgi:hypothetical protein